ncbi:MAG: hypothetical protein H6961_08425 [Chromatiaceae bacterium]|nr:hypothetical protein [Chromatiaceae bacterium]MCP5421974.1 hypothetical protein [Chromatiaceae bacterium]
MSNSVEKVVGDFDYVTVNIDFGEAPPDVGYDEFNDVARNFVAEKLAGSPLFDIFDEYQLDEDEYCDGKAIFSFFEFSSLDGVDALVDHLKSVANDFDFQEQLGK